MAALANEYNNFTVSLVFGVKSDGTGKHTPGAWSHGSHGIPPSPASPPSLVRLLASHYLFPSPRTLGPAQPAPSCLLPRAVTGPCQSIKPTCVPPLRSGPVGAWMQVQVGLGLGEHHLQHLQLGHGSTISALGWQDHSVCLVGTRQG